MNPGLPDLLATLGQLELLGLPDQQVTLDRLVLSAQPDPPDRQVLRALLSPANHCSLLSAPMEVQMSRSETR